ncbi:MAG: hypothetical protein CVV58_03120 [Tenericutes bacterium HGW-Tenericutes-3]|nr:MAG: hypothetical protein CVV58_03120 [Tenericutes bacterium HGW-Tenericutes-3]
MYANRMSFVIYYQGNKVLEKLKNLPVDVAFISKKQNYVVIYADQDQEQNIKKQMKDVKGFKHLSASQLFDPNLNF